MWETSNFSRARLVWAAKWQIFFPPPIFLKWGTLPFRHCNSNSRPTIKPYLNKCFINSIAMEENKQTNQQTHPRHAPSVMPTSTWVAAWRTDPPENSSGKRVVFCPMIYLIQFIQGPCKESASVLAEHFSDRVLECFDTKIQPNALRWTLMALHAHFVQLEEQKPNNWEDASLIGDGRQSPSDVCYFVESLNARLWKALTQTVSSCRRENWKQSTGRWEQDSAADKPPKLRCPLCPRTHRWKIMWTNLGSSFSPGSLSALCKAIYSMNNLHDCSYSFSSISACHA